MTIDNSIVESIANINLEIIETARNVNRLSYERKQITTESLLLISELTDKNSLISTKYKQVMENLKAYMLNIGTNVGRFRTNIGLFQDIFSEIQIIRDKLGSMTSKIMMLVDLVDAIKKDTENINILATNASIVSSKYNTAIFQILSDKFNKMAVYINQNLENIIKFVNPIKEGIENITKNNSLVISDIESGYQNYLLFLEKLGHQEDVIRKQMEKAENSGKEIESQKDMLADISTQILLMDSDAAKAIEGSGNVMKTGEGLKNAIESLSQAANNGGYNGDVLKTIDFITEQGSKINKNATTVNTRSKSQLNFSYTSLEFCKSMIQQSKDVKDTATVFNKQSTDNNRLAIKIGTSIHDILTELKEIERRIIASNETMTKFMQDYLSINKILGILESILNMMKILGIYSRIESSRDPVRFEGFLTISKNIQKLQNKIKSNIPKIDVNIKETSTFIESVNASYQNITRVFNRISENSLSFTEGLMNISDNSKNAEKISGLICDESINVDLLLNDLEKYLNRLTEVVKEPIEGSSKNITRGKFIEEKSMEIKEGLIQ